MENREILYETRGAVGVITINRPQALNTVTKEMAQATWDALQTIEKDPSIRVGVIRANGKVFCAGADFALLAELKPATKASAELKLLYEAVNYINTIPKPIIAAVQGAASGGGFSVALACDFIFASEKAKFGAVFVNIGLSPDTGGLRYLVNCAGPRRAKEMFMTGRLITAQEAMDYGIVYQITSPETLEDEVFAFAEQLAEKAPVSLCYIKTLCNTIDEVSPEAYLFIEREMLAKALQTDDHKEGVQAFLDKRKPIFTGE